MEIMGMRFFEEVAEIEEGEVPEDRAIVAKYRRFDDGTWELRTGEDTWESVSEAQTELLTSWYKDIAEVSKLLLISVRETEDGPVMCLGNVNGLMEWMSQHPGNRMALANMLAELAQRCAQNLPPFRGEIVVVPMPPVDIGPN